MAVTRKRPHKSCTENDSGTLTLSSQLFTAAFYGLASFLVVVVNKSVLTNYRFPSSLSVGTGQMLATVVVFRGAKSLNMIVFPAFDRNVPHKLTQNSSSRV
ncbi:UDP-glucuronic acid/UDP-N-acetylgalactosamine transporter-like isoform X2 [Myxocyprinus asiaticus]|uniref:UDP-glucuronic acid/UDP-N-acetylgalactosamine transporter-like isoform X2 n=1 Tax=Myxocyprinus asiaticus TaxID=70543 RepID=UPI0022213025|nr:UDP-glucuronic acid/UDP-N-acetylgalactosamine transporter-like isoform X2 [Myxocyprinus asiaticus]